MSLKFIGQKLGMTQVFDKNGNRIVCTVIFVGPNFVVQEKTKEKDGYNALQTASNLSSKKSQMKWTTKAMKGHFAKAKVEPCRHLVESKIDQTNELQVGSELSLSLLEGVDFVDVIGTSIGKGYQGVMKLHGFSGGPAAHGSGFHRHAGSTGMRSTPGRCLPGGPRASRMGGLRKTVQNLKVIELDLEKSLIIVKGAIPGPKHSLVYVRKAIKKHSGNRRSA